jgi:superfamily II DNA or RNA helicase
VTVREADWRVVQATPYADCTALDLVNVGHPVRSRTLLLPFDRPRRTRSPRLSLTSPRDWSNHVATLVTRTFPYGALRFVPNAIQLLPYQLEPALAVFRYASPRILVADDVGLGKTVEGGVIIREVVGRHSTARILVIVPAGLKGQWKQELAALFELTAIDAGAEWLRLSTRELPPDVNPWSLPGVYLASIDFVKRPEALSPLEAVRWDLLVVDEAHGATPGTDRLSAIDALACRSSTVVMLSATPHSGNQEQFDALCRIGAGQGGAPLVCFRRARADVDVPENLRSRVMAVAPTDQERQMHRLLERYTALLWSSQAGGTNPALLATIFRKRALSSAHSLALSLRRRLLSMQPAPPVGMQPWLPLFAEQDELGADEEAAGVLSGAGLQDRDGETIAIEENLRAAEAAAGAESKPLRLLRLLARAREPAIVFSEYRDTALRLSERLAEAGHRVLALHGGLGADERAAVIAEFNRGRAVMVATDAASEGLNLHRCCRLVVHYELPWSPARLHQRCGRVNRIGQLRRVHEIALVAADTAEQMVLQPLLRRAVRSGGFMRGSFVHRLPEALVAAHVLGGVPPEPAFAADGAAGSSDHLIWLDLEAEARLEVERLRTLRRLHRQTVAGSAGTIVPIQRMPPQMPARPLTRPRGRRQSVMVLFGVGFSEAGGEQIEEALLPIAVDYVGRPWRRGRSGLRRQVASVLTTLDRPLREAVRSFADGRLSAIAAVHLDAALARAQRQRALAKAMRSAAREMVQPGLFARRPVRTALITEADLLEESSAGEQAPQSITWQVRVEAVVCGSLP